MSIRRESARLRHRLPAEGGDERRTQIVDPHPDNDGGQRPRGGSAATGDAPPALPVLREAPEFQRSERGQLIRQRQKGDQGQRDCRERAEKPGRGSHWRTRFPNGENALNRLTSTRTAAPTCQA